MFIHHKPAHSKKVVPEIRECPHAFLKHSVGDHINPFPFLVRKYSSIPDCLKLFHKILAFTSCIAQIILHHFKKLHGIRRKTLWCLCFNSGKQQKENAKEGYSEMYHQL